MLKSKYLVGITGSIACYKTCHLISQLVKAGHEVQVVATTSALKFVGEATLEGLSRRPVVSDNFSNGHMMDHITLARWADVFIVAPLTASHLSKFAVGASDDLLSTLVLAYERHKPMYLAPAMNATMYSHPATQANLHLLSSWGAKIIEPASGLLACGEDGIGKMAEPDSILDFIKQTSCSKRLLVTYGGTQEPIDSVRSITNLSTGQTGRQLIENLCKLGHHVSALAGAHAVKTSSAQTLTTFTSHHDLSQKLTRELQNNDFDGVIHLAAVSDFSVDNILISGRELSPVPANLKLSSDDTVTLKLKRNSKIIKNLKATARNKNIKVIAFKLTNTLDHAAREAASIKLLTSSNVDYVVHNDLNEIDNDQGIHPFLLFRSNSKPIALKNINELALAIDTILQNKFLEPVQEGLLDEVTHDLVP